jgi:hypothetical protein
MSKKVVIAGSVTLQDKVQYWINYWEKKSCDVIDYPMGIQDTSFLKEYPQVYKTFFDNITKTDILFVMNEDKNGIKGYLGAESFAEMAFAVVQNQLFAKDIEIILLKMPVKEVPSYDEIILWLQLGWIKIFSDDLKAFL